MKQLRSLLLVITLLISFNFLISCKNNKITDNNITATINEYGALYSVLWAISPERKAQLLTQYKLNIHLYNQIIAKQNQFSDKDNKGKLNLNLVKWEKNDLIINETSNDEFIPVVAVDLDETFLDNSPVLAASLLDKRKFNHLNWDKWVKTQQAKIFAGVLNFVKHIYHNGGMIFFTSNRLQNKHLEDTKKNLIKEGFPEELLNDALWWMDGKKSKADRVLKEKEDRYEYINNNKVFILGKKVNVRIMMVIGDDINDFNSNFTNNKGITYRENYMEDNNIQKLFGEPAMAIRFSKENDKIIKYYANCGQSVDTLLLEKKQVQKISKEKYLLV